MHFRLIATSLTLWLSAMSLLAQNAQDQKFVHYVEPYGLVLIEAVKPGVTLYRLSQLYNVSIDSILNLNPDLDPRAIPLGYPVNIPIDRDAITGDLQDTTDALPIFHRVEPRETLYRIAKVYLDVPVDYVTKLNPRTDAGINIGEVLHLGWYHPRENFLHPAADPETTHPDSIRYEIRDYPKEYANQGKVIREQKGVAIWKPGNDKTHFFVLHPTALIGSYIEVTNPMLHRTLTAKVAGHIPPGMYPARVGLVVSPSVARALGVLDQQFFAKWRYVE